MMVNILCLEAIAMKIIASVAPLGALCICLTMYIDIIVMSREIENKQMIYVAKKLFKLMS